MKFSKTSPGVAWNINLQGNKKIKKKPVDSINRLSDFRTSTGVLGVRVRRFSILL